MLNLDDIKVEFESQGFRCTHLGISPTKEKTVLFFESVQKTESVKCPMCAGEVHIYENDQVGLKDSPLWIGTIHECSYVETKTLLRKNLHLQRTQKKTKPLPGMTAVFVRAQS